MAARKRPYEDSTCAPNAQQFAKRAGIDTHACRLILVSENCESAEWPTKVANAMCMRCLQPFSGEPWPRVIGFCTKQKLYRCLGFLCRARCAKSDVRERSRHGASNGYHHTEESWLECVARDYYGVNLAEVVPAPPLAYLPTLYGKHVRDNACANPLQAAVDEYRDGTPQCSVVAQLPFVRTTFFMEMAHASQAEEDRRAQNSQRIQQPAVTLENSNGGRLIEANKQVLRRKSAQPASQSSIRAAAAAATAATATASATAAAAPIQPTTVKAANASSSIESMLGIRRVPKTTATAAKK